MENPLKMDDFGGTPIFGNLHFYKFISGFSIGYTSHFLPGFAGGVG